jgi:signal transduction histidine kinase
MMEVAPEAVESASPSPRRRPGWTTDNPLVRAVGRVRLPLGAKLVLGFAFVAALLAVIAALGLLSLNQSNSRGEQLRSLRQTAAYARQMEAEANALSILVAQRSGAAFTSAPALRPEVYAATDSDVFQVLARFQSDVGLSAIAGGLSGYVRSVDPHFVPRLTATLAAFATAWGTVTTVDAKGTNPPFGPLARAGQLAGQAISEANLLDSETTHRANALVSANHSGFVHSRNLLIGVGAGSLVLALALGFLLSWSVVAPLRRTEERLAEIGAGDFARRLEVVNRDEIGTLALRVNRMSDELQRVYRELELASEHKSQFLATMSHELRTPLNAIIGFSEVLHEQMFGELNERQLAYVNDVLEAGRHLLSLINDVLDLAKIEAGRMELDLSQVAIPEILGSAVSMHAERASRGGIELALKTQPEEITVTADERRLRQVVFNLVSNAVKFTPADGRIDISARLVDDHVEVAVADTGPGIAAEDIDKIFEEFEQTREGKQAEGTGLGLPLSRKLVELHGGRLWAESDPGHGSTFRFTLPTEQET